MNLILLTALQDFQEEVIYELSWNPNESSMFSSSSYTSVRLLKFKKPNLDYNISTLWFLDTIQPPPTLQVYMQNAA